MLPWTRTFRDHFFWTLFVKLSNSFRARLDESFRCEGYSRARTRVELSERHVIEGAVSFIPTPAELEEFFYLVTR